MVKKPSKSKGTRLTETKKMFFAFQRSVSELEGGPLPDPFKYAEYDFALNDTLNILVQHLKENEYRPKRAENFDMPKGEFAIRPGLTLDVTDLTVIHKLASDFIVTLDAKLSSGVVAYRLRNDKKKCFRIERESAYYVLPRYKRNRVKIEESWYNLWPKYRKQMKKDLQSKKYSFVASTDITAFFEDVNLLTLGEILKKKSGASIKQINMIIEILRSWALRDPANIRQRRGLPQGINMSGVLSNHYLQIVDDYLENVHKRASTKDKIKWYRYCDDIHVLCKTKGRAKAILLNIGRLLRQLGLNQNAKKTNILTAEEALKTMYYSVAEEVSEIVDLSKKRGANRDDLIERLKIEFRQLPKRTASYKKRHETALFGFYNAARILDSDILLNRAKHDFEKFPTRAKNISGYLRSFVGRKKVFRDISELMLKKNRILLYNYQIAFLVTIFRGCNNQDKKIFDAIVEVARSKERHWYVKVQAISTLFYYGIGYLRETHLRDFISKRHHKQVRRASMVLLPLLFKKDEVLKRLDDYAGELNVTVSRMANFLLALVEDKEIAISHLRRFTTPNFIFLTDQIWRLWFISLNEKPDVRKKFDSTIKKLKKEFRLNKLVKVHLSAIDNFRSEGKTKMTDKRQ
ncbi:MAG: RNA-directed DNA polymerase [Candidatus Ancaeobacter aquaticus]|nr:RNA-directed DNA polymerase [Candidatus Ancaeobacter aquaticus]